MVDGCLFNLAENGSKGGPPGWVLSMMMAEQHQTRTHKVIPANFQDFEGLTLINSPNRIYLYYICAFLVVKYVVKVLIPLFYVGKHFYVGFWLWLMIFSISKVIVLY